MDNKQKYTYERTTDYYYKDTDEIITIDIEFDRNTAKAQGKGNLVTN